MPKRRPANPRPVAPKPQPAPVVPERKVVAPKRPKKPTKASEPLLKSDRPLIIATLVLVALLHVKQLEWKLPIPFPPSPNPVVVPIAKEGFRAIVVYESADGLPQQVSGEDVRGYLRTKCVQAVDGTPEYRFWDKDTDLSAVDSYWKDAMSRKRDSLPWLLCSNGKTGFEGPLPATPAEVLAVLKKNGGE